MSHIQNPVDRPRRSFRFSLRTFILFVALVACALGWLNWQRRTVHDRRAAIVSIRASGGAVFGSEISWPQSPRVETLRPANYHYKISKLREWLGDSAVQLIGFNRQLTAADRQAIALFPEAEVQGIPSRSE